MIVSGTAGRQVLMNADRLRSCPSAVRSPPALKSVSDALRQDLPTAARIRDFVIGQPSTRKFIVVAHSKGAADTMVALGVYGWQLAR